MSETIALASMALSIVILLVLMVRNTWRTIDMLDQLDFRLVELTAVIKRASQDESV